MFQDSSKGYIVCGCVCLYHLHALTDNCKSVPETCDPEQKKTMTKTRINKLAKLRRHASRVHFAKIHFGKTYFLQGLLSLDRRSDELWEHSLAARLWEDSWEMWEARDPDNEHFGQGQWPRWVLGGPGLSPNLSLN